MLFLMLACQSSLHYGNHTWVEESEQNQVLSDAFFQPHGLRPWKEGWLVADKGDNALLWLNDNNEVEVLFDNLDTPKEIVQGENQLYINGAETLYLLDEQNQISIIASERIEPKNLIDTPIGLLWTEENDVWQYQNAQRVAAQKI